jgi:hypothetical protein
MPSTPLLIAASMTDEPLSTTTSLRCPSNSMNIIFGMIFLIAQIYPHHSSARNVPPG